MVAENYRSEQWDVVLVGQQDSSAEVFAASQALTLEDDSWLLQAVFSALCMPCTPSNKSVFKTVRWLLPAFRIACLLSADTFVFNSCCPNQLPSCLGKMHCTLPHGELCLSFRVSLQCPSLLAALLTSALLCSEGLHRTCSAVLLQNRKLEWVQAHHPLTVPSLSSEP